MMFLFNLLTFRFHVNFEGCMWCMCFKFERLSVKFFVVRAAWGIGAPSRTVQPAVRTGWASATQKRFTKTLGRNQTLWKHLWSFPKCNGKNLSDFFLTKYCPDIWLKRNLASKWTLRFHDTNFLPHFFFPPVTSVYMKRTSPQKYQTNFAINHHVSCFTDAIAASRFMKPVVKTW